MHCTLGPGSRVIAWRIALLTNVITKESAAMSGQAVHALDSLELPMLVDEASGLLVNRQCTDLLQMKLHLGRKRQAISFDQTW